MAWPLQGKLRGSDTGLHGLTGMVTGDEMEAFAQGWFAARTGASRLDNAFPLDTIEGQAWLDGFNLSIKLGW